MTGDRPNRLYDIVRRQLAAQCQWAGLSADRAEMAGSLFDTFCAESLDGPAELPYRGLSSINADGLPFQWSQSFGAIPRSVRFVCESGYQHTSASVRQSLSIERLAKARAMLGFPIAPWFDSSLLPLIMAGDEMPSHWRSSIWFGVGIANTGAVIKPYFNLNRGSPLDRWKTVGRILRETAHPDCLAKLCELSGAVSKDSWPVGLTVDLGASADPTRMKVYFRSDRVDLSWIERWYSASGYSFHNAAIRSLLDLFPCDGVKFFPEGAFVVALEFHLKSGVVSIKTDIALNKLGYERGGVTEGTRRAVLNIAGENTGVNTWLESLGMGDESATTSPLRFVGVGSEPDRSLHVNVYAEPVIGGLSPPMTSVKGCLTKTLSNPLEAIEQGLAFLARQAKDGHWIDYRLPVGESDAWVTAYVLFRLADVPDELKSSELRRVIDNALNWLTGAQCHGGGWGYSRQIEADADSTSLALLALHRHGRALPEDAVKFLLGCMKSDGMFSTYPKGSGHGVGWESAHLEITLTAWAALKGCVPSEKWNQSVTFIEKAISRGHGPKPYWWVTPLYCDATATSLNELNGKTARSIDNENQIQTRVAINSFEIALSLLSSAAINKSSESNQALVARLMERQQEDGSWPSSAWLRLVNPNCLQPSTTIDSGSLFVDQHAIFTTATALSALLKLQRE